MLLKENFFKNYFSNSAEYKKNIIKTKKTFKHLLLNIKNNKIPPLISFEKNYKYSFSKLSIKKFSKYKNIIIVGMGGSSLGAKAIYSFFKKKINKKIFFFDNLDLDLNLKYKEIKNLKRSCFILVSKSGNTLETLVNFGTIFSKKIFKNKLVVITELADNSLIKIAKKYNAEIIEHKKFIGGRYSVLSETGMFPAALMGLKLEKFKNLNNLLKNKNFVDSLIHNVASIFTLNLRGYNNSIVINYNSSLNDLGYWYQQLSAESLGKKGKGINPFLSFAPKDHHSLMQLYLNGPKDKFFTFFNSEEKESKIKVNLNIYNENLSLKNKRLKSIIDAQNKATKNIFKLKKIPFRQINFKNRNEDELGKIFTFFMLETILLSYLLDVNAFNQPAVEEIKIETKKFLR